MASGSDRNRSGGSGADASSGLRSRGGAGRTVELDAEQISRLMSRLDVRLRARGVTGQLYVVGGAAVMAQTGLRRVTRDVDVTRLEPAVAEEARAVAREEGLPADWLSSAAGAWAPPRSDDALDGEKEAEASSEPGLTVRYASAEELLAMKMLALRSQDADDIIALSDVLGLRGEPASCFVGLLRRVYPDASNLGLLLGVGDDDLESELTALADLIARLTSTD